MAKRKIYRQGDVLFVKVKSFPKKKVEKLQHRIIAEGEATGHRHEIVPDTAILYGPRQDENRFSLDFDRDVRKNYLEVLSDSNVTHNEHGPILLPKGKYEIVIQREYSPVENNRRGYRNVMD